MISSYRMPVVFRILMMLTIVLVIMQTQAFASGKRIILAGKGIAPAVVVVPAAPLTLSERLAAKDLVSYLSRVTGQKVLQLTEGQELGQRCCIYVGSAADRKLGLDVKKFDDEQWIVRTVNGNLFLTGGVFHGPEYAAYHFLEDIAGIHWWNPFEDFVPEKREMSIPELNIQGKPVFSNRQQFGNGRVGSAEFLSRNRIYRNYHVGESGRMLYYQEALGSPYSNGHSLGTLVPKSDFEGHPEWFAMIDGKRSRDSGGYCLTNLELRDVVTERMKNDHMMSTRSYAAQFGAPFFPRIYDISQNDGAPWCQCPTCTALYKAEGSQAGPLLSFVNGVAGTLHSEYPEPVFTTLAYQGSRLPPKSINPLDCVVVRWCSESLNMARPITDPVNQSVLKQFQTWAELAAKMGVWLYGSAFSYMEPYGGYGVAWDFPVPNERNFAPDYRVYARSGVAFIGQETMEPDLIGNDMQDMKVWLSNKLMENPYLDYNVLLNKFTDGFYGPISGKYIRDYRKALEAADARKPSVICISSSLSDFKYLDLEFLSKANAILDRAEKAAMKNPVYLSRVRRARSSVDRSILFLWPGLVREWVLAGHSPDTMPFMREVSMARYKKMAEDRFLQCIAGPAEKPDDGLDVESARAVLAKQLKFWESNDYIPAPIPVKFAAVPKDCVFDYPAGNSSFRLPENSRAQLTRDPEAAGGWAVKVSINASELSLVCGIRTAYGSNAPFENIRLVSEPGYHWYDLGKTSLAGDSFLHFFPDNEVRVVFREIGACEVWASIKVNDGNGINIERVILTKPNDRILGNLTMPEEWLVFTGLDKSDPVLPVEILKSVPADIEVGSRKIKGVTVKSVDGKFDFADISGAPAEGKTAYAFLKMKAARDIDVTLGFGADWWLQAWLDGKTICDTTKFGNGSWPPTFKDYTSTVKLTKGDHVLAVRHLSGNGSSSLVIGGPDDLRK